MDVKAQTKKRLEAGIHDAFWVERALAEDGYVGMNGVSYGDLIDAMPLQGLFSRDFGDYQGDTVTVVKDGERYGLLVYGWGSCSGCDALQDCKTWAEVNELAEKLYGEILWSESKAGFADVALPTTEWYSYDREIHDYVKEIAAWARGGLEPAKVESSE